MGGERRVVGGEEWWREKRKGGEKRGRAERKGEGGRVEKKG